MITFDIKGTKDIIKRLNEIDNKLEKRIGKKAVRAGGSEYAKLVRRELPMSNEDDVHLKKSIGIATPKGKRKNNIAVQVGIKGKARYYAHVFEFGSRFVTGSRTFTRTFESSTRAILDRIANRLRKELEKV